MGAVYSDCLCVQQFSRQGLPSLLSLGTGKDSSIPGFPLSLLSTAGVTGSDENSVSVRCCQRGLIMHGGGPPGHQLCPLGRQPSLLLRGMKQSDGMKSQSQLDRQREQTQKQNRAVDLKPS